MLKGQGSDSPLVASVIQKLKTKPEYAEVFAKLEQGASQAVQKGMTPVTKVKTEEEATSSIVTRIQREMDGLKQARADAGSRVFEKAKEYGGNNAIVEPKQTIKAIDELIADYSKKLTPN
jgi:hypothetical protein